MHCTRLVLLVAAAIATASCTSGDDAAEPAPAATPTQAPSTTTLASEPVAGLDSLISAMPIPDLVDPDAELRCDRYDFECSFLSLSETEMQANLDLSDELIEAFGRHDDPSDKIMAGLSLLNERVDIGHVLVSDETFTSITFSIGDGPEFSVLTSAAELQGTLSVPRSSDAESATALAAPARLPERYEPAGGPRSESRSALILDPFFSAEEQWSLGSDVAAIFEADEDYTTVHHRRDAEVNFLTVSSIGNYDSVHIVGHGGGSCPTWTDDRDECSSEFVGGRFDQEAFTNDQMGELAENMVSSPDRVLDGTRLVTTESDPGQNRLAYSDDFLRRLPSVDDTIVFFAVCGSDAGFNNAGLGASVGWTGTSRVEIVGPISTEFWSLMVNDGVEFEKARDLIKEAGDDQHNGIESLMPNVNFFTETAFAGDNLRARDVVELRIDGEKPAGQAVEFNGVPADTNKETLPVADQQLTILVEGVASGSQGSVSIELRLDGELLETDIELARDGTMLEPAGDGYASWLVTVKPDAIRIPDVSLADLEASAPLKDFEVRAFETNSQYSARGGPIRLGTELEAAGPVPIFSQLSDQLSAVGATLDGNELVITFDTAGGPVTGTFLAILSGGPYAGGYFQLDLTGTYDPGTETMSGEARGIANDFFGLAAGDDASGTWTASVDLSAGVVTAVLDVGTGVQTVQANIRL